MNNFNQQNDYVAVGSTTNGVPLHVKLSTGEVVTIHNNREFKVLDPQNNGQYFVNTGNSNEYIGDRTTAIVNAIQQLSAARQQQNMGGGNQFQQPQQMQQMQGSAYYGYNNQSNSNGGHSTADMFGGNTESKPQVQNNDHTSMFNDKSNYSESKPLENNGVKTNFNNEVPLEGYEFDLFTPPGFYTEKELVSNNVFKYAIKRREGLSLDKQLHDLAYNELIGEDGKVNIEYKNEVLIVADSAKSISRRLTDFCISEESKYHIVDVIKSVPLLKEGESEDYVNGKLEVSKYYLSLEFSSLTELHTKMSNDYNLACANDSRMFTKKSLEELDKELTRSLNNFFKFTSVPGVYLDSFLEDFVPMLTDVTSKEDEVAKSSIIKCLESFKVFLLKSQKAIKDNYEDILKSEGLEIGKNITSYLYGEYYKVLISLSNDLAIRFRELEGTMQVTAESNPYLYKTLKELNNKNYLTFTFLIHVPANEGYYRVTKDFNKDTFYVAEINI